MISNKVERTSKETIVIQFYICPAVVLRDWRKPWKCSVKIGQLGRDSNRSW